MAIDQKTKVYIDERFEEAIKYYWKASRNNKRYYKLTRSLTVVLGALVTLIASLSAGEYVESGFWAAALTIGTPILAATLTIATGLGQTFQWGAAWQDMVLTAERLQKERDLLECKSLNKRDCEKELAILNDLILEESHDFFERMLGGAKPATQPKE